MQGNKKIIITGGHATCALAVIDELQKNQHKCLIVFVGRRYVNADEHNDSFEYQEITARKIPFIHLETGRAMQFFKFISGLINSFSIVARHKPDTILSFGGYLALPIAIAGWILGVKIVTHEQTIEPGTANRIIGVIATKVCISFPETKKFFAKEKVVLTGNPLRTSIFKREEKFVLPKGRQSIYITGGSLGSHAINILIEEIIRDLLKKYTVVHQCGNIDEFGDYERLNKIRNSLSLEDKKHYLLKKHLMDNEIGDVYAKTDLVIGRSGANTFFELIALEKPAIFIPLPWSAKDEQKKHAMIFQNAGAGEVFFQEGSGRELLLIIEKAISSIDKYKANISKLKHYYKPHAKDEIIKLLLEK